MEDWQYRIVEERLQLTARIAKLVEALKRPRADLTAREGLLLREQLAHMLLYQCVLDERIERFESPRPQHQEGFDPKIDAY